MEKDGGRGGRRFMEGKREERERGTKINSRKVGKKLSQRFFSLEEG